MKQIKFKETEIGKIPEEWEESKIGIKCKIKNGKTNSQDAVDNGQYPLFDRSSQIKKSNKFLFNCEAIIVPGEGKDFIPRYFNGKFDLHQRAYAIWKEEGNINLKFLYYWILKNRDYFARIAVGSTVKSLRLNHLENFPLAVPPILEQSAIAKILSDLDSKIELNLEMNKTLEAIGQALFKRWFIDFEFPNENGETYKSSGGEMVDSELGEIPKGWEAKSLGEFIDVERGLSYKGKFLAEEGIPMINLGTMAPHFGFLYDGLKFYVGEFKERNLVKPGDLVIANTDITQKRDVLGSPAIVPSGLGNEKILFTHHIYTVRTKTTLPNLFIYYLLQLKEYKDRARGFATGTTVLALPSDAILDFGFVLPREEILAKFISLAGKIRGKININNLQNKKLFQIRDSLLPRLMSGRIRVNVG